MSRTASDAHAAMPTRAPAISRRSGDDIGATPAQAFHAAVAALFDAHFERLFRLLDRLSGDPDLAADLAQEAFVRLYRRAALPDAPHAWLISVALNLFRNVASTRARRRRLLTVTRAEGVMSDPPGMPGHSEHVADSAERVRAALDRLPERERRMLLLRAEGYTYRDIATALEINEASIGTLLARAKHAFRDAYGDDRDAP